MNRCLFLDDLYISEMKGLTVKGHKAKRYAGNPVMKKKYPWENSRMQLYGKCIVYNEEIELFQMFYLAQASSAFYPNIKVNGARKVGHATLPAYAESVDGVNWYRPLRPDVSFNDISDTNLLNLHEGQSFEPGIMWDPYDQDPQKRYKAFIWDQHFDLPFDGRLNYLREPYRLKQIISKDDEILSEGLYYDWGIRVAFSYDGIHWTKHPSWVFRCYSDTGHSILYDTKIEKYVAFGRFNKILPTLSGKGFNVWRDVARVQSDDFINWSEPELVLAPDDKDPEGLQINSMPVDLYEGVYIGLMELDVRPKQLPVQMAASHDGRRWTRVADRFIFLDKGEEGEWDQKCATSIVRPATGLIKYKDEVRMYYNAGNDEDPFLGVGMASWRRDGFVSLRADNEGGELLTKAFVPDGSELHLNIDASHGEAVVRVCDQQGYPVNNPDGIYDRKNTSYTGWKVSALSKPICGDHLDVTVKWDENDLEDRIGKPITLRIKMKNADLYSFWTE